jgi:hypothetical protein
MELKLKQRFKKEIELVKHQKLNIIKRFLKKRLF